MEESIGTMKMENEAFKTIWIAFSVALTTFVVGPILSCSLFKKITTSFHLCHDVIAEEIEKENALANEDSNAHANTSSTPPPIFVQSTCL